MEGYKKFKIASLSIVLFMGCMNIHAAADDRKEQIDPVTVALRAIAETACYTAGAAVTSYVIGMILKKYGLIADDATVLRVTGRTAGLTTGALIMTNNSLLSEALRIAAILKKADS